ncbi:cytochrome c [Acidobacteria bacterium AB60]|nr:cytochrome c [Acidobacteria bacterium AB60]
MGAEKNQPAARCHSPTPATEETDMRTPLLLLPAVLLVGYAVSAPAQAKTGEVPAHVKTIYKVDCALCHGENGNGKTDLATGMGLTLSDFTDPKTLQNKTDEELFSLIRKGRDKMPPEEETRAKDAEIKSLILYVRGLSKGQPAPAETPAAAPAATPAPAPASAPSSR